MGENEYLKNGYFDKSNNETGKAYGWNENWIINGHHYAIGKIVCSKNLEFGKEGYCENFDKYAPKPATEPFLAWFRGFGGVFAYSELSQQFTSEKEKGILSFVLRIHSTGLK